MEESPPRHRGRIHHSGGYQATREDALIWSAGIMQLTPEQRERIVSIVRSHLGSDAEVWLYGSRTRSEGRGGDVDLLIKTEQEVDAIDQALVHSSLEQAVSLPVDVSFIHPRLGMNRFQRLVAAEAVLLEPCG